MKSHVMTLEPELPVNGVKIVFFVGEFYFEVLAQDIRYMVELFEATIIGDYGFCAAK